MKSPILSGIYADANSELRTSYPRNLVPVLKESGISDAYLRPADGIEQTGTTLGVDRGGINWNGVLYRVSGERLVRVAADGTVTDLGNVGGSGPVTLDYGFDRLAIASGGFLYYWDGSTLTRVTDPDLGEVIDLKWIAGYYLTTDGTSLVTTDLNDPTSVQTLHYGSSEADPDQILAVDSLRNEAYAFNRYTIETFQNVGGTGFPFQRIEGALVPKGIIGTQMYAPLGNTFAFVGSGRGEAPAVYIMVPGDTQKVSTREIDQILLQYSEQDLAACVMETRVDRAHQHVLIHLPDRCLVYDTIQSAAFGQHLWFTLDSGSGVAHAQYRARGLVWAYGQWNVGDPTSTKLGKMVPGVSTQYGASVPWEFGTMIAYNEGNSAIIHDMELVCLAGNVAAGSDPVIWTSYSHDGETWSQERPTRAGKQGQRRQRITWREQGQLRNWRLQRFRGNSDAHLSIARLEFQVEPLFDKAVPGG